MAGDKAEQALHIAVVVVLVVGAAGRVYVTVAVYSNTTAAAHEKTSIKVSVQSHGTARVVVGHRPLVAAVVVGIAAAGEA